MKTARQLMAGFCLGMTLVMIFLCAWLPSSPHMVALEESIRTRPKFVKVESAVNLTGPTVNPILSQVNWLEDLSWKDPPVCNGSDPFILAVVMSAVGNFEQRMRVRKTWANTEFSKYTGIKAVFVLGSSDNETLLDALDEEMTSYQDIIQNDFVDSYRNLTYKMISSLSWVSDFCPDTPFIAKIDDDVIVNPFNLRLYLHQHLASDPSPMVIHGRARFRAKPMRDSKWAVTEEEYPGDSYPPFVLGSAYIVDRNAVDRLLSYVPYVPMLWLEDVYLTGLVAKEAGIKLKQAERRLYTRKITRKLYYGTVGLYIGPNEKNMKIAWRGILKHSKRLINKIMRR